MCNKNRNDWLNTELSTQNALQTVLFSFLPTNNTVELITSMIFCNIMKFISIFFLQWSYRYTHKDLTDDFLCKFWNFLDVYFLTIF